MDECRELVYGMSEEEALFAVNTMGLIPRGGAYTAGAYDSRLAEAGFVDFVIPIPGKETHQILILARNP